MSWILGRQSIGVATMVLTTGWGCDGGDEQRSAASLSAGLVFAAALSEMEPQ